MINLSQFDMADYIKTKDDAIEFLDLAIEENNVDFLLVVLGKIAKSEGMTQIARELGVARESLYTSLSADGNPSIRTVLKLLDVLGFRFSVKEKTAAETEAETTEKEVCTV